MDNIPATLGVADVAAWDRSTDIVIIGLGIAGACAAIEAKAAGADILVIERASGGGGASALAAGHFYLGGGTAVQKAVGVEDDADEMFKFLAAITDPIDRDALWKFCQHSRSHFDWLEEQGIPFDRTYWKDRAVIAPEGWGLLTTGNEKVWPYREIARPAARGHQVAGPLGEGGALMMRKLIGRCEELGVPTLFDCCVNAFVVGEGGRVVGMRARAGGSDIFVHARKAVILAAGGFGMDRELIREVAPHIGDNCEPLGIPHNDGLGLRLGVSVGGAVASMGGIMSTSPFYPPSQLTKGIAVNKNGQRFVAEDSYHGRTAHYTFRQPDKRAWLIVDSEIFAYPEGGFQQHQLVDGWDDIAAMEADLGMPRGSLEQTMEAYNSDAANGQDRRFGKHPDWLKPLDKGPWAAFDISADRSTYYYITIGGLRTDANARVLDDHGNPIPGLYAAGACTDHFARDGDSYHSGSSLAQGSFFGRISGRHAAGADA